MEISPDERLEDESEAEIDESFADVDMDDNEDDEEERVQQETGEVAVGDRQSSMLESRGEPKKRLLFLTDGVIHLQKVQHESERMRTASTNVDTQKITAFAIPKSSIQLAIFANMKDLRCYTIVRMARRFHSVAVTVQRVRIHQC